MVDILMKIAILILIPTSTVYPDRWWVLKQSSANDLVQHMFDRGNKGSILTEPLCGHFGPWYSFSFASSLLGFYSDLVCPIFLRLLLPSGL